MAGETLSTELELIVADIRKKSRTKALQMGVCKNLVTVWSEKNGNKISQPVWDMNTGGDAIVKAEGVDYTEFATYKNGKFEIVPTKKVFGTKLTDEDNWFANENVREKHTQKHAAVHAIKMEQDIVATFANFTGGTITNIAGMTLANVMDGVTELESSVFDIPEGNYSFVTNAGGYGNLAKDMAQQGVTSTYGPVGRLADAVLAKYHVATVLGTVNVFRTTTKAMARGAASVSGLFTKDAIGLFVPVFYEFETQRDATAGTTELVSRCVFGAGVQEAGYGVKIVSKTN